eukprot:CAMPEP_0115881184 /NCGR_PEP_ID=MMETSP0287-20121206/28288_1 /TAXON_ID=412157 /ORGANISM="Chrysochromulina rotalis, Strain UIO044" /LENGTH=70 /DNA_ID=CAMNT_0003337083 /DNA_START=48 /DNA_END=257 /DNA_ORIENTATION=-
MTCVPTAAAPLYFKSRTGVTATGVVNVPVPTSYTPTLGESYGAKTTLLMVSTAAAPLKYLELAPPGSGDG